MNVDRLPWRSRLLLVAAWTVVALSVTWSLSTPSRALAIGACSAVIPVDALANSVFATGASGALAVGTIDAPVVVVAGGAAPVAATAGTVGLAAAAFLASVYGTCKFLDVVFGDVAAQNVTPAVGEADTYLGQPRPCAELLPGGVPAFPTSTPSGDWRCRLLIWVNGSPFGAAQQMFGNRACTTTRGGVTQPRLDFSKPQVIGSPPYVSGQVWEAEAGHMQAAGDSVGACGAPLRLSSAGTQWCADVVTAGCSIEAGITSMKLAYECSNASVTEDAASTWLNVGSQCGHAPGETIYFAPPAVGGGPYGGFSAVLSAWPEAREFGWERRTVTDVQCSGAGWVRAVSAPYFDRQPSQRVKTPSCPTGERAKRIRSWRVPMGVSCDVGANCWDQRLGRNQIFEWSEPTVWATASAPSWTACLAAGATCGDPVTVSGACQWGGFAVASSFCDPGKQLGTTTVGGPVAQPSTTPATCTGICPTTETATAPPSTTVPGGTGTASVPIDNDGETQPRDQGAEGAACMPQGWGWFNPITWVLKPIKCAAEWAFVPDPVELQTRLDRFAELRSQPPIQWVTEGIVYVQESAFLFVPWSTGGPDCTTLMGAQVCPRQWDSTTGLPAWLLAAVMFGAYSLVVFAIWRFF